MRPSLLALVLLFLTTVAPATAQSSLVPGRSVALPDTEVRSWQVTRVEAAQTGGHP